MLEVRAIDEADRGWVDDLLTQRWGSTRIVTRGRVHDGLALPGFIAMRDGERIGLVTHTRDRPGCELTSLDSTVEGVGAGSALVEAVVDAARQAGCRRVWLITTNDNTAALRFYQRRGFRFVAVHRNALEGSRRLKPEIPLVGIDGIAIRDEIELERVL